MIVQRYPEPFIAPMRAELTRLGFDELRTPEAVDEWYGWVRQNGAKILREIKTHRDGARSFYFSDPDGVVIQMIYHLPVAERARGQTRP